MATSRVAERWLGIGLVALGIGLATNTALGPIGLGVVTYPFTETVYNETLGLEAISLVLVAPLAVAAGVLSFRGRLIGPVLGLGPAGYAAYMLVQYVIGPQYRTFQLSIAVHLALFVLALLVLAAAWTGTKRDGFPRLSHAWPIVILLFAAFVVSRWAPAFAGMLSGGAVPAAAPDLTMYWSIFFLDMGVIVPIAIATGVGLAAGAGWAQRAAFGLLGWFALVPPSVAAMSIVKILRADPNASTGDAMTFVIVTVVFWVVAALAFRRLLEREAPASVSLRDHEILASA